MAETVRIEIPIETVDKTEPGISGATKKIDKFGDSAKKAQEKVTKFDSQAEKTQKSLLKWAKEKYEIALEAKERITPVLSAVNGKLKSVAGKTWSVTLKAFDLVTAPVRGILNLLKNPVLQAGAVLGVSIGLKDTVDTFKDFEAAMSQVKAISGASESEFTKLTAKAKEMGATTKFTATESAEAFNYMAMAGWNAQQMTDGIGGILNLAAASGEDLATTSDIVTDALTAFGLKASDATHFSDVLAMAASSANTTVSGMGETFKYAGSMAGSLGYSIEDVALATGLMANSGIKGTMAGTALNSMFTRLATDAGASSKQLGALGTLTKKLGVQFYDAHGNARDLSDVLGEMRHATQGMNDQEKSAIANKIAGMEAQKGLLAILNASEEDYNKLAEAINNADGAASNMSDTMLDNLQGSLTLLQSAVDGVKIAFGQRLAPYVRSFAEWLTEQMPAIEQGLDRFMDKVDRKIDEMKHRLSQLTNTKEWADSGLFGKAGLLFDEFIGQPFLNWWKTTGKSMVANVAGEAGQMIGSGLKTGILLLLGIDLEDTASEGVSIGRQFAAGFSEGFDFDLIKEKIWDGLSNLFSSASKFLPGGESPDLTSLLSLGMLMKIGSPLFSLGKGAFSLGKAVFGKGESGVSLASRVLGSFSVADELAGVGNVAGSGLLGLFGKTGIALGSGASSAAGLAAAGGASIAGGVAAGATLISAGIDTYKAIKSDDKAEKSAYGKSAGWKAGGVAAGAAIGTLIAPGVGTLIGAGIGGIAGWIKGDSVKEEYQKSAEEAEAVNDKIKAVYEATGTTIRKNAKFASESLKEAFNDSNVSADEFAKRFKESVEEIKNSHFGDIVLSLKEVKELADRISFGNVKQNFESLSEASENVTKSFDSYETALKSLNRENQKAKLGFIFDETDRDAYVETLKSAVEEAKTLLENIGIEATASIRLLFDSSDNSMGSAAASIYTQLMQQADTIGSAISDRVKILLDGGVIELNKDEELLNLQKQLTDITDALSQARAASKQSSWKIKFGNGRLSAESISQLQEEVMKDNEEIVQGYDEAMENTNASNWLRIGREEGYTQESYEADVQAVGEQRRAKIEALSKDTMKYFMDCLSEGYNKELDGILPDIEGTLSEKLQKAMEDALKIDPDVDKWAEKDEWLRNMFGLTALKDDDFGAVKEYILAAAKTVPQTYRDALNEAWQASNVVPEANPELLKDPALIENATEAGAGVAVSVADGFASEIREQQEAVSAATKDAIQSGITAATLNPFLTQIRLDVNYAEPVLKTVGNGSGKSSGSKEGPLPSVKILSKNALFRASGGFVSGRQLSWVGEEGPEAIIPLVPGRRARALDLFKRTASILGFRAGEHAAGGFVGDRIPDEKGVYGNYSDESYTEVPSGSMEAAAGTGVQSSNQVTVSISMNPEFVIQSSDAQSEESIMRIIRKNMKGISDDMGGAIAERLEKVFSNMPLKEA